MPRGQMRIALRFKQVPGAGAPAPAPRERDVVSGDDQGRSHIAQEIHHQDDVQGRRCGAHTKDDCAGPVHE